ncbi:MAG TPA: hypothetical protein DHN29_24445 [Cytophagales bacterium]|nr:hypothetical protein [Cytophagales bacterium]|tara:strand:- start:35 stop:265 length:231 start_codon:yes stop_codon:yes gene_type:complete
MLQVMLICGITTTIGIVFLMIKAGIREVIKYDLVIDLGVTILLIWVFSGSTTGIVTGAFTGALLSVVLFLIKKIID